MFNEKLHKKLVDLYTIPNVDEVIFSTGKNLDKPAKCWICHHKPCICR